MDILAARKFVKPSLVVASVTILSACASQIEKPQELACVGSATYQVTFDSTWTSATHPEDFPAKPHYSHLFGVTHNYEASFWEPGDTVSIGIKYIAEKGLGYKLLNEVKSAIKKDRAKAFFEGNEMPLSPGQSIAEFELDGEFSRVTLINMLAPSPDWITGVSELNLCVNGQWAETKSMPAKVYDAGTDDGRTYTAEDEPRKSREPVVLLSESGRSAYSSFPDVGTFEFKKIN